MAVMHEWPATAKTKLAEHTLSRESVRRQFAVIADLGTPRKVHDDYCRQ